MTVSSLTPMMHVVRAVSEYVQELLNFYFDGDNPVLCAQVADKSNKYEEAMYFLSCQYSLRS